MNSLDGQERSRKYQMSPYFMGLERSIEHRIVLGREAARARALEFNRVQTASSSTRSHRSRSCRPVQSSTSESALSQEDRVLVGRTKDPSTQRQAALRGECVPRGSRVESTNGHSKRKLPRNSSSHGIPKYVPCIDVPSSVCRRRTLAPVKSTKKIQRSRPVKYPTPSFSMAQALASPLSVRLPSLDNALSSH